MDAIRSDWPNGRAANLELKPARARLAAARPVHRGAGRLDAPCEHGTPGAGLDALRCPACVDLTGGYA